MKAVNAFFVLVSVWGPLLTFSLDFIEKVQFLKYFPNLKAQIYRKKKDYLTEITHGFSMDIDIILHLRIKLWN